jgi:hypothetical protein
VKITIDGVERDDRRELWLAAVTVTDDAGTTTRLGHAFPLDAMEWRAAEYGIASTDRATLLDIILTEPHLTAEDWATGHRLHDAPDIDTARQDHLARCAKAKLRCRLSTRGKGSPLDRVRAESILHAEVIAVKAEVVAQARVQEAAKRRAAARVASAAAESGADRAARLRRQFFPPPSPRNEGI